MAEAARAQPTERRRLLAAAMGHRAVLDYELSEPRYSEVLESLERMPVASRPSLVLREDLTADQTIPADTVGSRKVAVARRFQALKEDARHHSLHELAVLRRAVLALDRRLELGGLAFFLRWD